MNFRYTPQYRYMNELQQKYGNRSGHCSLQIFGFPSNQFGYQVGLLDMLSHAIFFPSHISNMIFFE